MQLREVMTKQVDVISPDATVSEAARHMRDGDFGMIPVGEKDRLVGAITDRDITVRAIAEGRDPQTCTVREAMSQGIDYCFEDVSLEEASQLMQEKQIRRLPVLNRDKQLVGIVAMADLATTSSGIRPAAEALSEVSKEK